MDATDQPVPRPKVLLHWDAEGVFSWAATAGVDVACVDERCPDDRVYLKDGEDETDRVPMQAIERVEDGRARHPVDALDQIERGQ